MLALLFRSLVIACQDALTILQARLEGPQRGHRGRWSASSLRPHLVIECHSSGLVDDANCLIVRAKESLCLTVRATISEAERSLSTGASRSAAKTRHADQNCLSQKIKRSKNNVQKPTNAAVSSRRAYSLTEETSFRNSAGSKPIASDSLRNSSTSIWR